MFKKFIDRIIAAKDREDAIAHVFYGTTFDENGNIKEYGIDLAYQHGKISWQDHERLLDLIEKMA